MFFLSKLKVPIMGALLCGSALVLAAPSARAEDTETVVHTFTGSTSDGANPYAGLTLASNGVFYGTTFAGGSAGDGSVYSVTESGTVTLLHSFNSGVANDGFEPLAGVTLGSDGSIYGTTLGGGADKKGTVYKISPSGTYSILHSFTGTTDGARLQSAITIGDDGKLYGTADADTDDSNGSGGTIFSMNTDGSSYLVQYRFPAPDSNGTTIAGTPNGTLTLVPGSTTAFYGTTTYGGSPNAGTVYMFTPGTTDGGGTIKVLHTFGDGSVNQDGMYPQYGRLALDSSGNIYGTTVGGGNSSYGTIFKLTPSGTLTILYSFDGFTDGEAPQGSLLFGSDGNFYGTASAEGYQNAGTIFQITPAGQFKYVYDFNDENANDGGDPYASPIEDSEGNLLGTTYFDNGSSSNQGLGVVYKLAASLPNPVKASSVKLSPNTVVCGSANSTGTITLAMPAPTGGTVVTLASSNTSAATVPTSVTVAANSETAMFTVTSKSVTSSTSATITATYNSSSASAKLAITSSGPALSALTLSPTSVAGGASTTANSVTLSAAATASTTVTLSSSNTGVATVPSSVVIASGSSSASFTINTSAVTATETVTITASYNGTTKTATLTVNPPPIALKSVTLSPTSTTGGTSTTANRIYLTGDATASTVVTLASSNTNVATLAANTVTISSGASSHTFTISTKAVSSAQTVTILANYNGVTQMATLTVTPAPAPLMVSSVSLNPTSVVGGQANSTGTVTLNAAAPSGGAVVTLGSSDSSASVPGTVTVAAGATSATFTVTTNAVTAQTTATISAIYGGAYQFAALTVSPPASSGATLKSVTLSPTSTEGGTSTTANRVYFTSAPTSSQTATLTSSNTAVATVPSSVIVGSGSTSHTFTITTKAVTSTQTVTITAKSGNVTQTATLTVTP